MIPYLAPEPLRGEALRAALAEIGNRSMLPEYQQPVVEAAEERPGVQGRRSTPSPKAKARQMEAQQRKVRESLANRPAGCITVREAAAIMGWRSEFPIHKRAKAAGIKRESYDGIHAWYSEAKLRAAKIIPAMLLALLPGVAMAESLPMAQVAVCDRREELLAQFRIKFGEELAGYGLAASGGNVFELLVDPADGTWTILRTFAEPDSGDIGSCVMATGRQWQAEPAGDPS